LEKRQRMGLTPSAKRVTRWMALGRRGLGAEIRYSGAHRQPRRAALIAAMSIFFMPIITLNARFAPSPPAANASVSTRGVICQETPHLSLHQPHALSCPPLPTIAFQ